MNRYIKSIAAASAVSLLLCGCSTEADNESIPDNTSSVSDTELLDEAVQPFKDYFSGFLAKDGEKVLFSTTPQTYIDEMKATGKYEELLSQTVDSLIPVTLGSWEEQYGDNVSVEFIEITDSSRLSAEQLDLAELCYKYGYYDINAEAEVAEGFEVKFRYSISGSESSVENELTNCFVRIDNDGWKMLSITAADLEQFRGADSIKSEENPET